MLRQILALTLALFLAKGLAAPSPSAAQENQIRFHVLALAEHGGIHKPFVDAAKSWLDKLAAENRFAVDYLEDTQPIDDAFLAKYRLFIQLNYPPYNWTDKSQAAFIRYIEQGKGWEKIDTWTASGLNPTEGKFGFYLPAKDEIYISNFSFNRN